MITKTAREIIRSALTYANSRNTEYVDFELATNLLNTEYKKLYDEIVSNSFDFVKEIKLTSKDTTLPEDCYQIISVLDNCNKPITPSPMQNKIGYWVENGILHCDQYQGTTLRYAPIPDTITAPDTAIEITDIDNIPTDNRSYEITGNIDDGFEYSENEDYAGENYDVFQFLNGLLYVSRDLQSFYYVPYSERAEIDENDLTEEYDITDLFKYKVNNDVEVLPVNVQVSNPYIVVSYAEDKLPIYLFTGWTKTIWNYNIIKGKPTYGTVVAFTSDDSTGKGLVWKNNDKYYYCSFVPDTVLEYPTSALFTLLEYRIAATLLGLMGMENNYLVEKLLPDAEAQFYKTLSFGRSATRINNMTPYRRYI